MPKIKGFPSKRNMKTTTTDLSLSENQASDDGMDVEQDSQKAKNSASKLLASALLQSEKKLPHSSTSSRSNALRKATYAEARKNAKEVVQVGVGTLESLRAQLEDFRAQELGFQKHRDDCSLPMLTHKKTLEEMEGFYEPLLKGLGGKRSSQVNDANRMLRNNDKQRQDALENSSRGARHQLELTRQMEKDAIDARELIKSTKNLLHMKPRRKVHGKQIDRE